MKKEKKSIFNSFKFKLFLVIGITIITSASLTFGFFYAGREQTGSSGMTTLNCFDISFTDGDSINLTKALSMTDEIGQQTAPYTFTIENNCNTATNYYVILNVKENSFSSDYINVSLNGKTPQTLSGKEENKSFDIPEGYTKSYILDKGTLTQGAPKTYDTRLWINAQTTYEQVQGKTFEAQIKVVSVVSELDNKLNPTLVDRIKATAKEGSPNFANTATTDETADGLYAMEDDYGTSYYYRGAVTNNYVKFGGFYWRIIRINGDGSMRMIYDGTSAHANGVSDTNRLALINIVWNGEYNDAKYVGYMYSPSGTTASTSKEQAQTNEVNTNIKTQLENWYKTNIKDNGLDMHVADSIYCNDRSVPGKSETGWSDDTGLGYGSNKTGYGGYARLGVNSTGPNYNNPKPTFVCPNKNDAFTKEDVEKGNGKLGEKVGLITVDEIVAAGSGKYATANSNYYLYKGNWYWSLSPHVFNGTYSRVFGVPTDGNLYSNYVNNTASGVAPVISLRAEYVSTLRGEGTQTSPYEAP